MSAFAKCVCSCGQPIEFPVEMAGGIINCPSCEAEMELPPSASTHKLGLLSSLVQKYHDRKQHKLNLESFHSELVSALSDGILTPQELQHLAETRESLGVNDTETAHWGKTLFEAAVKRAKAGGHISPTGEAELRKIQGFLNVGKEESSAALIEIYRSRKLYDIQSGTLPPLIVMGLLLAPRETALWSEPGRLYEERVVSRHYEGGSQGVSIRVMKGVSFRVGNHRGRLISETGNLPISGGRLVITNQRLIFQGDQKSFVTKLNKIF